MSSKKNAKLTRAATLANNAAIAPVQSTPTTGSSQPSGPPLPAVNGSPVATPIVN